MKETKKQSIDRRWYIFPKQGLRVVCCDCGNEHLAEFRYKNDKIQYRAFKTK